MTDPDTTATEPVGPDRLSPVPCWPIPDTPAATT